MCPNAVQMVGSKEAALEQQQTMGVLRQKYGEAQEELDEMRAVIEDQAGHLEGYRNKVTCTPVDTDFQLRVIERFMSMTRHYVLQYLMAQQQVEEQRRHMEQMESEQDRITDQVQAEVHRVKVSPLTVTQTDSCQPGASRPGRM